MNAEPAFANAALEPGVPPPRGKSALRALIEDLLVTACGAATSAAVVYGSVAIARRYDVAVYTWMANFIIPIGAILCGFVAATGYWLGALWFHHRPTRLLLVNIVVVALTTYFSIHHLNYTHLMERASFGQTMSFPDYMVAVVENMVYKTSGSSGEGTALGKWGWGVAALQVLGFCLGGFGVYGILASIPFCDRCSMYFKTLWRRVSRWKDLAAMGDAYQQVAGLLAGGQLQVAVNQHAALGEARRFGVKGMLNLELRKCPNCENRRLKLVATRRSGNNWRTVGSVVIPTEQAVEKAGA